MFNRDREQYIGTIYEPGEARRGAVSAKLQRLDEVWKAYREFGSGRALSEGKAQVVYMHARYYAVARGSGMADNDISVIVGFSHEDYWAKLKRLKLTHSQEWGLENRAEHIINITEDTTKLIQMHKRKHTEPLLDRILKKIPEVRVDIKLRRRR